MVVTVAPLSPIFIARGFMGFFSSIASIAAPIIGGLMSNESNEDAGNANAALQREFAQNGIRWKVADAEAAGIHPLYALGAQTSPASPLS